MIKHELQKLQKPSNSKDVLHGKNVYLRIDDMSILEKRQLMDNLRGDNDSCFKYRRDLRGQVSNQQVEVG